MLLTGPLRLGPLVLTRPIGQGGMGTVWHARHPEGVDCAVKVLRPEYAADRAQMEAFRREVGSVASLDHPNVVRVFDTGIVPGAAAAASGQQLLPDSPWLSMEYADKGTLGDQDEATSWDELVAIVRQILEGLAHSHARGIVHRDLKPRNVLLHTPPVGTQPSGDAHIRVTLTDFGIAAALANRSSDGAQAGTPGYMAPEQILGDWRSLGPPTDLYALGSLAWRLATGRAAFGGGANPVVLRAQLENDLRPFQPVFEIPPGFEGWVRRLLARSADDRFACAADAANALAHVTERRRSPFRMPASWRPAHPATRSRPKGTGLALFLLRPWPLVGREEIQDHLWDRLRAVATSRRSQVVILYGAEGLGRSRIGAWLRERSLETGSAWVLGSGQRSSLAEDLGALLAVDGLSRDEAVRRIAGWLALRGASDPEHEAHEFYTLLSDEGLTKIPLWLELLDRISHDRATLLFVDDLHDTNAAPLLKQLADSDRPVLAVATLRAEPAVPDHILELLTECAHWIPIEPLTRDEQRQLVNGGVGLSPGLAERVVDRTDGIPGLAVRLVVDWAKRGVLLPTSTGYDFREGSKLSVPENVAQPLRERLRVLREPAIRALEALAILGGRDVAETGWAETCASLGTVLDDAVLDEIDASGVARTPDDATPLWSFHPTLLADVVVDALPPEKARTLHESVARALLAVPTPAGVDRAVHHLIEAGLPNGALKAIRALIGSDGIHPDRRAALLTQEAQLLDAVGAPPDDPRRLLAQVDAAWDGYYHLDVVEALAHRAAALRDPAVCARIGATMVERLDRASLLAPGDPRITAAEAWARQGNQPRASLRATCARARALFRTGEPAAAERLIRAVLPQATHFPGEEGRLVLALGEGLSRTSEAAAAQAFLRAEQCLAWHEDPLGPAWLWMTRSRAARLTTTPNLSRALECARHARHELTEAGFEPIWAELLMGICHLARGELSQARALLGPVASSEEPGICTIGGGALLASLVPTLEWATIDGLIAQARSAPPELADPDLPWPLEWAAKRLSDAGAVDRAEICLALAADHYGRIRDADGVARVRRQGRRSA